MAKKSVLFNALVILGFFVCCGLIYYFTIKLLDSTQKQNTMKRPHIVEDKNGIIIPYSDAVNSYTSTQTPQGRMGIVYGHTKPKQQQPSEEPQPIRG